MNKNLRLLGVGLALLSGLSFAALAESKSAVVGGARWHAEHSVFTDLPYGKGDLSYALGYEYREKAALWQLLADYAPNLTGTNHSQYAVTPQLNLLFQDRIWRLGVGVLNGYVVRDAPAKDDWTGFYWQFIAGIDVPIHKFSLGVSVFYPFAHWGEVEEFDYRDLDYGVSLSYRF